MDVEKGQSESAHAAAIPLVTSCGWKRSNDDSLMSNLKEQFHDFVNTPMADHKVCFKNIINEVHKYLCLKNSSYYVFRFFQNKINSPSIFWKREKNILDQMVELDIVCLKFLLLLLVCKMVENFRKEVHGLKGGKSSATIQFLRRIIRDSIGHDTAHVQANFNQFY